jgi:DNA-binding transcriptional regulator YiaG
MAHEANYLGSYKKLVGDRIKAARIKAGFANQEALAVRLNVDRTRVSRWESGENLPKGKLATQLLKAVRASQEEIFAVTVRDPEPGSEGPLDASAGLEILSKYQGLSPSLKLLALSVLYEDASYLRQLSPAARLLVAEMLVDLQKKIQVPS